MPSPDEDEVAISWDKHGMLDSHPHQARTFNLAVCLSDSHSDVIAVLREECKLPVELYDVWIDQQRPDASISITRLAWKRLRSENGPLRLKVVAKAEASAQAEIKTEKDKTKEKGKVIEREAEGRAPMTPATPIALSSSRQAAHEEVVPPTPEAADTGSFDVGMAAPAQKDSVAPVASTSNAIAPDQHPAAPKVSEPSSRSAIPSDDSSESTRRSSAPTLTPRRGSASSVSSYHTSPSEQVVGERSSRSRSPTSPRQRERDSAPSPSTKPQIRLTDLFGSTSASTARIATRDKGKGKAKRRASDASLNDAEPSAAQASFIKPAGKRPRVSGSPELLSEEYSSEGPETSEESRARASTTTTSSSQEDWGVGLNSTGQIDFVPLQTSSRRTTAAQKGARDVEVGASGHLQTPHSDFADEEDEEEEGPKPKMMDFDDENSSGSSGTDIDTNIAAEDRQRLTQLDNSQRDARLQTTLSSPVQKPIIAPVATSVGLSSSTDVPMASVGANTTGVGRSMKIVSNIYRRHSSSVRPVPALDAASHQPPIPRVEPGQSTSSSYQPKSTSSAENSSSRSSFRGVVIRSPPRHNSASQQLSASTSNIGLQSDSSSASSFSASQPAQAQRGAPVPRSYSTSQLVASPRACSSQSKFLSRRKSEVGKPKHGGKSLSPPPLPLIDPNEPRAPLPPLPALTSERARRFNINFRFPTNNLPRRNFTYQKPYTTPIALAIVPSGNFGSKRLAATLEEVHLRLQREVNVGKEKGRVDAKDLHFRLETDKGPIWVSGASSSDTFDTTLEEIGFLYDESGRSIIDVFWGRLPPELVEEVAQ